MLPDGRHFERNHLGAYSFWLVVTSAVLVVPVVATNLIHKKRRNSPSIYSTVFLGTSFVYSLAFVATSTPVLGTDALLATSPLCIMQGVVIQFCVCMLLLSWLLCAYALYKIVTGPPSAIEKLSAYRRRHIIGCMVLSAALTAFPYLLIGAPEPQQNGLFCWLNNDVSLFWSKFASFLVWFFLILCIGCYYIIAVLRKLCAVFNEQTEEGPRLAIRDFVHRHTLLMLAFLVVFVCVAQQVVIRMCYSRGWIKDDPFPTDNTTSSTMSNTANATATFYSPSYPPPMLQQVSELVFTLAYSSVGLLGFLVFGTARALRHIWWAAMCGPSSDQNGCGPKYASSGSISTMDMDNGTRHSYVVSFEADSVIWSEELVYGRDGDGGYRSLSESLMTQSLP